MPSDCHIDWQSTAESPAPLQQQQQQHLPLLLCPDAASTTELGAASAATPSSLNSLSSLATSGSNGPLLQHAKSLPLLGQLGRSTLVVVQEPRRSRTLFEGLLGCLRPMWAIVGKRAVGYETGGGMRTAAGTSAVLPAWNVDMLDILDLQFVTSGSQGAVFYGVYRGQEVAVKKFTEPPEVSLLDLRHLRDLRHPHVVQFLGACVSDPACSCLVMEYCPYGNLYDFYTTKVECLPAAKVLDWSRQLASGMAYLHECQIAHGDLKSPNILVCDQDVLKISDFGLVRVPELESQSSSAGPACSRQATSRLLQLYGTVRWISPEQCRQESWGYKADVYSYGVIVWELLFQEVPYRDVDRWAVVLGVGQGTLSLPLPRHTPGTVRTLMESCWSGKPKCRPAFATIQNSLDMSCSDLLVLSDGDLRILRKAWSAEICQALSSMRQEDHRAKIEADLIRQRRDELQHATDIRQHYERKLNRVDNLQMDLTNLRLRLMTQAREAQERSRDLHRFVRDRCCRTCRQALMAADCFHETGGKIGTQMAPLPVRQKARAVNFSEVAVQTEDLQPLLSPHRADESSPPQLRPHPGRRTAACGAPGCGDSAGSSSASPSNSGNSANGGASSRTFGASSSSGCGQGVVLLSAELITRELQDNMTDSLSDKEAAFDQFKHSHSQQHNQRHSVLAAAAAAAASAAGESCSRDRDSSATEFNVMQLTSENYDDAEVLIKPSGDLAAVHQTLHPLRRSEGCSNGFRPNSAFI